MYLGFTVLGVFLTLLDPFPVFTPVQYCGLQGPNCEYSTVRDVPFLRYVLGAACMMWPGQRLLKASFLVPVTEIPIK